MSQKPRQPGFSSASDDLRQKLHRRMNIAAIGAAAIFLPFVPLRALVLGFNPRQFLLTLFFCAFLLIFLVRRHLGPRVSAAGMLLTLVAWVLTGIGINGVLATTHLVVPFVTIFASIVLGRRVAFWLFCTSTLGLVLIAALYLGGVLHYQFDVLAWVHSWVSWVALIVLETMLALWYFFIVAPIDEAQRHLSERLEAVLEGINDALFVHDKDTGAILQVNQKMCALWGYSAEEILALDVGAISAGEPPYSQEEARTWIRKAASDGPQLFTWLAKHREGKLFWVEVNMRLASLDGTDRVLVVARDISDRKQVETALSAKEEQYRSIVENAPMGIFRRELEGQYLYSNDTLARLFECETQDEFYSRYGSIQQRWAHPELHDVFKTQLLSSGNVLGFEVESRLVTGKTKWFSVYAYLEPSETTFNGFALDITERKLAEDHLKQAQTNLQESEARFNAAFHFMPVGAGITTLREGRFIAVNRHYEEVFGYCEAELVGHTSSDFGIWVDPKDRAYVVSMLEGGQSVYAHECQIRRKNGSLGWVSYSGALVVQDGVEYLLSGAVDITKRKLAEASLQESRDRNLTILQAAMDGFFLADGHGRLLEVNDRYCQMSGHSRDELLEMSLFDLVALGTPEETRARMREVASRGEHRFESRHRRRDGSFIDVDVSAQYRPVEEGRLVVFLRDITQRKRAEAERQSLEAQLHQSQKMESIGRLAGGVAHDFNNLLGVVLGEAELALADMSEDDPQRGTLERIESAVERSSALTRQLLAFARQQPVAPRVLDLNKTVEGMLHMLRRLIGEDVALSWHPGRELGSVKLDPSQIDQILANLCVNARDAIGGVGAVTIETANVVLDDADCAEHRDAAPGDYVMLSVSDDGCGMTQEVKERLFEPFFTTKEIGKGTGLGLSTVYGVVKQNEGFITVHSEAGQGTTFRIYLRQHRGPAATDELSGMTAGRRSNDETVLLVEDDPNVLRVTQRMLETLGFKVLPAATPTGALASEAVHGGEIHLIMTDVVMPQMNGRELFERIAARRPGIKCLYASGYTADVIARHGVLDPGVNYLSKPVSLRSLSDKLREVLDDRLCLGSR